jgi:DNA-J related protein/DnaJ domain
MYAFAQITETIHRYLQAQDGPIREYQLIQMLDATQALAPANSLSGLLQIFHKHFVTTHCLYLLRQTVFPQRLDIGPLAIQLHPLPVTSANHHDRTIEDLMDTASGRKDVVEEWSDLGDFYLDLSHLYNTDEDSVVDLLTQFWMRLNAQTDSTEAYAALDLDPEANWQEVKLAYRQKVQRAHPDKGGDVQDFVRARRAYQVLKKHLQQ